MSEQMNDETKQRRLITADLLDATSQLIDAAKCTNADSLPIPKHTLDNAVNAFNAAQKQWSDEAKLNVEPETFPCALCHFTYRDETNRDKCFAQHRYAIETQADEADKLKPFIFHLPVHDHDEVQVKAPDLATAREMLYDWVERGRYAGEEVVVLKENTDDGAARHWKEEVNDAPAFDENNEQIDT